MKNKPSSRPHSTTYALLTRIEDVKQSASETVIYLLLIVIAAFSMWLAAHEPIRLPVGAILHTTISHPAAVQKPLG